MIFNDLAEEIRIALEGRSKQQQHAGARAVADRADPRVAHTRAQMAASPLKTTKPQRVARQLVQVDRLAARRVRDPLVDKGAARSFQRRVLAAKFRVGKPPEAKSGSSSRGLALVSLFHRLVGKKSPKLVPQAEASMFSDLISEIGKVVEARTKQQQVRGQVAAARTSGGAIIKRQVSGKWRHASDRITGLARHSVKLGRNNQDLLALNALVKAEQPKAVHMKWLKHELKGRALDRKYGRTVEGRSKP